MRSSDHPNLTSVTRLLWPSFALLMSAGWIYSAGIGGSFHLDDQATLRLLNATASSSDLSMYEWLSHGLAQISGFARILPQLSFMFQANAWPDSPANFIAANICIHLANGLLVFFLAGALARLARLPHPERIALLAAAIWLLSPIQVSGVLYVVQRINQMAAFFVFAGALIYLHGRAQIERGGLRPAFWMALGVFGGGGLAVLCKENGALLPLLLLAAEATLLPAITSPAYRRLRYGLLGLPLILLAATLAWRHTSIMAGYAIRDFTWIERLLTQPGILLHYAQQILLPRGYGLGLFHDDYPIASWPTNLTASIEIIVFITLVAGAIYFRRRWPLFAFGILWFVAGHAMEASWIPLEMYFEHRNHVPLFGLAFAMAALVFHANDRLGARPRALLAASMGAWLLTASFVTYGQTSLWGKPDALVQVWYKEHPQSPRAISRMADLFAQHGDLSSAEKLLRQLAEGPKQFHEIYGQWLRFGCLGEIDLPKIETVTAAYRSVRLSNAPPNGLALIADWMEGGMCPRLDPAAMLELVMSLRENPAYAPKIVDLQTLAGRFLELGGQHAQALEEIGAAYRASGNPELGFIELRLLNALERRAEAEQRLDALERHIRAGGARHARYLRDVENWRRHLGGDGQQDR